MQIILDDFATNRENMQEPLWLLEHVNKLFQLAMVGIKVLFPISHRKHTKSNGQNFVGRGELNSRARGTRREPLLRRDKIEW